MLIIRYNMKKPHYLRFGLVKRSADLLVMVRGLTEIG